MAATRQVAQPVAVQIQQVAQLVERSTLDSGISALLVVNVPLVEKTTPLLGPKALSLVKTNESVCSSWLVWLGKYGHLPYEKLSSSAAGTR